MVFHANILMASKWLVLVFLVIMILAANYLSMTTLIYTWVVRGRSKFTWPAKISEIWSLLDVR